MSINPDKITAYCRAHSEIRDIVHEVLLFDGVVSTNDIALEMAADGMPGGLAILAESQSGGKGRLGRSWFSPPGKNIHLSLLLRPALQAREYPLFSPAAALGMLKGIREATGLEAGIKWPNDLVLSGKKVGGVLLVSGASGGQTPPLVIGLGLNVNPDHTDFPEELREIATSLKIASNTNMDRNVLIMDLLKAVSAEIHRLQGGEIKAVMDEVRLHCVTLGKKVRVATERRVFEGRAENIADDGALQIKLGDHSTRSVLMGDITHLREASAAKAAESH